MPTGYTARIKEGITFKEFAFDCVRAFGACITMRDDPNNASIPEVFTPSDYHLKELANAEAELGRLNELDASEAARSALVEFVQEALWQEKAIAEDRELMSQYRDMLYQVNQWRPPTPDHEEFKKFMIQQLESSIKIDGMEDYYIKHPAKKLTGEEWLDKKRQKAQWDIASHTRGNADEIDRMNSWNAWIKALRDS